MTILHKQHCKVSRYSGYFIWRDTISSVQHYFQVFYFLTSQLSINQSTSICPLDHFTIPNQYLFLSVSPYTHTRSHPTTSTETTTPAPSNSFHVTQTDFSTTIKDLLANFDDKFKESLKETIADQDAKFDEEI